VDRSKYSLILVSLPLLSSQIRTIGISTLVPGAGLFVEAGHWSVTTALCTYSQHSLVPSMLVKTLKGKRPSPIHVSVLPRIDSPAA